MTERKFQKACGPELPTGAPFRLPTVAPRAGTQGPGPSADMASLPSYILSPRGTAASFYQRGSQAGRAVDGTGPGRDMGLSPAHLSRAPSYPCNPSVPKLQGLLEAHPLLCLRQPVLCQGELPGRRAFLAAKCRVKAFPAWQQVLPLPEPPL